MDDRSHIKKDTINGVLWSVVSKLSQIVVQFIVTIILSRLLCPDDFATIGLLSVFLLLSNVIVDSGFGQALIRKESIEQADYSSVFIFNLLIGSILYLILYLIADFLGVYFHNESLPSVSRIVFLTIILNSFAVVPNAILSRELAFRKLFIANVLSAIISAACGIYCAYHNFGVYALVVQMLSFSIVYTVVVFVVAQWIPQLFFSWMRIQGLLSFSLNLLGTGIIIIVFNNLYSLIIGRFYTQTELGYYTQAKKLEEVPSLSITNIIQNVSYSAMAKVKDDDYLIRIAYKKILFQNVYVVFPIMAFCLISARSLIPFLLGDQWLNSIPYFQILCIYGALFPLFSINTNILKVKGMGKDILQLEIIRRALMLLFLFVTIKKGIPQMLWGWVLSMFISIIYSFRVCGRPVNYSVLSQLKDLAPYLVIASLSALLPLLVNSVLCSMPLFWSVSIQAVLYFSVYFLLSVVLKPQAYLDLKDIIVKFSLSQFLLSK